MSTESAGDPPQGRAGALATYRKQFAQLQNPQYVLSQVAVRKATSAGATAEARYAITSDAGTVRGAIAFQLVREGDDLEIVDLRIQPD